MGRLDDGHLAALFAAGALSAFRQAGGTEKDAEAFLAGALEKNASRDEYYDDEETLWDRHKGWIIPAVLASGAFLLGGEAGKHGRPDRSLVRNAWDIAGRRLKALVGIVDDPIFDSSLDITERIVVPGHKSTDGVKEMNLIDGKRYV